MKKSNFKDIEEPVPSIVARTKREAIKILECGGNVLNLDEFNDSYLVMYSAVVKDGSKLGICSDKLKKNRRLVYSAVLNYSKAIFLADPMYLNDKTAIIYAFIGSDGELSLKHFNPEFSKDYNIAFFAIMSNKDEINNIDDVLRNNSTFMEAVNTELEHADKTYKKAM